MKHYYLPVILAGFASSCLLTACTDEGYDLSDIDTTTQLAINDLTIPVNIDQLKLSAVIDLKETETIKIINGDYCFVKEDEFHSNSIKINPVTLSLATPIKPSSKTFDLSMFSGIDISKIPNFSHEFDLSAAPSAFDVSTSGVPESIKGITDVTGDMEVSLTLSLEGFGNSLKGLDLTNVVIDLPKGLEVLPGTGTYDKDNGKYTIGNIRMDGSSAQIKIHISKINCKEAGVTLDAAKQTINFSGNIGIESATAKLTTDDLTLTHLPANVTYKTAYSISDIRLTAFSGSADYQINDLNIPRVELSDLPDVLNQAGTNISLVNPQLYLSVNNPLSTANVGASLDLNVISHGNNPQPKSFPMNNPLVINPAPAAVYCLSPMKPYSTPIEYQEAEWHEYANLGKVLEGDGLPKSLDFEVVNPQLIGDNVKDLKIGTPYNAVTGKYYFRAPLALGAGSKLAYSDVTDGWWDEEMDKLEIKTLEVTTKITSDVPVKLKLEAWPVDKNGMTIDDVEITVTEIPACTKDKPVIDFPVTISMTGDIKGLDGVRYKATASSPEDAAALNENMNIILKEVRAKVSGVYTTDF